MPYHDHEKMKRGSLLRYYKNREKDIARRVEYAKTHPPDPLKQSAREKVQQAVFHRKIVKPTCCSRCGSNLPKNKIHAHHKDYAKPFGIEWVCSSCHSEIHGEGEAI